MKNTFWFRHFLLCDRFAKIACSDLSIKNFAKIIYDEQNGAYANSQMSRFFWIADKFLCELSFSDYLQVFDNLEYEDDITIEQLATLTSEEIDYYYKEFILDKNYTLKFA